METERIRKDYEHEKHQDRKRKAAHLEAIFEQAGKKSTQDNNENNNKDSLMNTENEDLASSSSPQILPHNTTYESAGKSSTNARNYSLRNTGNSVVNAGSPYGVHGNPMGNPRCSPGKNASPSGNTANPLKNSRNAIGNRMEHSRNIPGISSRSLEKTINSMENTSPYQNDDNTLRESERDNPGRQVEESEDNHYTGFKQIQGSSVESKGSEIQTVVTIKQEKPDEPTPVHIMPAQTQVEREKSSAEDNGEIGEDCLKFLLFSGKLYHCERISDLTHSFSRFIGDNVLGRKGKVVVLLLFHKRLREVYNYVVGVVDHYTVEEHNIIIKVIKHHAYPTTTIPTKEVEKNSSKLVVGSKKLLYNLQPLNGPVYTELVKILDGFGANSAVDHVKISEFNAMVNANADRLDGQISNVLGRAVYPYRGTFSNRSFVPSTYMGSRYPSSNPTYTPLANQLNTTDRYSPEKSQGGNLHDRLKSAESDTIYQRRMNTSYYRDGQQVNTVSANQSVRITPRTTNDHIRTSSVVPIVPNARFRSTLEDASLVSQRRNVEDLQTVAELCKEKMKRDMAEQELKSIKAAFEEFKSQMQQHLSQVEERMVLLEAENRTLKGKLSNMHQNNFAEKKYHELRNQLEDLLKSA